MAVQELKLTHVPPVKAGMLVRRPRAEVFNALVDPAITTRFWFTKSSGRLAPGARVRWEWEMYGASTEVSVRELEEPERLVFDWGDADTTTVDFRFIPVADGRTYVQITETGLHGNGDQIVSRVAGSTGGFYQVLCALKALLEHDAAVPIVADSHPPEGLEV
jgi:uncharacterized protein YndB with AHSA1/START domain